MIVLGAQDERITESLSIQPRWLYERRNTIVYHILDPSLEIKRAGASYSVRFHNRFPQGVLRYVSGPQAPLTKENWRLSLHSPSYYRDAIDDLANERALLQYLRANETWAGLTSVCSDLTCSGAKPGLRFKDAPILMILEPKELPTRHIENKALDWSSRHTMVETLHLDIIH